MRLEFLHHLIGVVDQREASALTTTVLSPEAKAADLVFVGFVELGKLLAELVFGDVRAVRVEDVAMTQKSAILSVLARQADKMLCVQE